LVLEMVTVAVKPEIVIKWDEKIRGITRAAGLTEDEVKQLEQKIIQACSRKAVEDNDS
jgi:hypothetical protein